MKPLTGMTWEHPRGHGSMAAAAEAYCVATGQQVDWQFRSLQAFADAPLEELSARFDLLVIDHPHVPLAAEQGWLAELDGHGHDVELADLAEHSVGRSHQSYQHDGHQWALATDAAAQVAVYRPDLLPEPPRDWDGVLALAGQGRVLWPAKPIDAFSSLVTVSASADGTGFLDANRLAAALELLQRLADLVPPDCLTQNPIEVAERLSTGDRFSYAPLLFGYSNYSRVGFREHRLRYIDIPLMPRGSEPLGSLLGGAGIAVSAHCPDPDAAREFAFWAAGAQAQTGVYFDGGGQPGHALAWQDDRLNEETLDFFRGTRQTLEGACVRPRTAGYLEFQDLVSPLVTAALQHRISDQDLIDQLNRAAETWPSQEDRAHA